MLNTINPPIYQLLRERTGLTQEALAVALGVNRATVSRYESGRAQPDKEREEKLLELAKCSKEELAELVCEQLSKLTGRRVGILESRGGYEPTTALAKAYAVVRDHAERLSNTLMRALNNKIGTTQLMGLTLERLNADLVELTRDCLEEIENHQGETTG